MTVGRGGLATCTFILCSLGAGGCGEGPAPRHDSVSSASQALATQVGSALDVQKYPTPQRALQESPSQVVCGTQRCLQFVDGSLGLSAGAVYAAPISDQGTQLSPRYVLGQGYLASVAAKGDEFLAVLVTSDVGAYSWTETAVLLDGATGSIKKSVVLKPPSQGSLSAGYALAGTGSSWAFLRSFVGSTSTSLILLDGTTLASREFTGPLLPDQYATVSMVAGPNQYLAYTSGSAWRINAATGAVSTARPSSCRSTARAGPP